MRQLLQKQQIFFNSQQTKSITYRENVLKKLRQEIIANEDAICDAIYADFKKPKFETITTETQFVLAEINNALKNLKKWSKPKKVASSLLNWPSYDWVYKEPYGNVLIIAPWNYPFQLAIAPLIGAIAAGNTAVIKPSELTPNTAAIISTIISAVFSPEYVTVVEGGVNISQQLLAQKWNYIFFTGSTHVGQIVYESAAKHLTPVALELGGKNPCIVDATATISTAAKRIVWGKFMNAGQTCIATDYILVHKSIKDKLIKSIKECITTFYSDTIETSKDYARVINPKHYKRLKLMLENQEILFGGNYTDADNYLAPTLVNEPSIDSDLMKDEIFGPILPIISYETLEDIHSYITNYEKPLATYVFSENKSFQDKILNTYSFGSGAINDTVIQVANKKLPFGGVGASGIGSYHGKNSFFLFSHQKSIIKKPTWLDIPLRYPPYNLPIKWAKKLRKIF